MIPAWRIDKAKRPPRESFSGHGTSMSGGRWNHEGVRMVYAAASLSLAAYEKLVHLGDEGRSLKLARYKIDIPPEAVEEQDRKSLPDDWKDVPAPESTKELGSRWAQAMRSAVLKVPSVLIETEHNYLLNPLHPEFKRLKISPPEPFLFDDRLWPRANR